MPLIEVRYVEGRIDDAQKGELIQKLTDTLVEVMGEKMRPHTWVIVEEVKSGDWAAAGERIY